MKKKSGKPRVCIDFTYLNKACEKDCFPLLKIDVLVDAIGNHEMMSSLDAFSGYNKIRMDLIYEEKTYFLTERGIYCYKVMSFQLKNAKATYQQLIKETMEEYINDIRVKSKESHQHLLYMEETFWIVDHFRMILNPTKCSFEVTTEKFLGYLVSGEGSKQTWFKLRKYLTCHHLWIERRYKRWPVGSLVSAGLSCAYMIGAKPFSKFKGMKVLNWHKNVMRLSKNWKSTLFPAIVKKIEPWKRLFICIYQCRK